MGLARLCEAVHWIRRTVGTREGRTDAPLDRALSLLLWEAASLTTGPILHTTLNRLNIDTLAFQEIATWWRRQHVYTVAAATTYLRRRSTALSRAAPGGPRALPELAPYDDLHPYLLVRILRRADPQDALRRSVIHGSHGSARSRPSGWPDRVGAPVPDPQQRSVSPVSTRSRDTLPDLAEPNPGNIYCAKCTAQGTLLWPL